MATGWVGIVVLVVRLGAAKAPASDAKHAEQCTRPPHLGERANEPDHNADACQALPGGRAALRGRRRTFGLRRGRSGRLHEAAAGSKGARPDGDAARTLLSLPRDTDDSSSSPLCAAGREA